MVGGQFLVTGAASLIVTLVFFPQARQADVLMPFSAGLRSDLAMLVILATLLAFGLMIFFQPKVDPTRAALIYLTEPVFAAGFAWVLKGRNLGAHEIAGAVLIIAANSLVEWLNARRNPAKSDFLGPKSSSAAVSISDEGG